MGLAIYAKICGSDGPVQVLTNAILLEGVTTWVIEVSNKVKCFF